MRDFLQTKVGMSHGFSAGRKENWKLTCDSWVELKGVADPIGVDRRAEGEGAGDDDDEGVVVVVDVGR